MNAGIVGTLFTFIFLPIGVGPIAPGFIIALSLGMLESTALITTLSIGFWFLFGALLGKFINKLGWATLIWLAVVMIGGRFIMWIGPLL